MPPLQVKDCPVDLYESLRAYAAQENRSISQQTITILQEYLGMREPSPISTQRPEQSDRSTRIAEASQTDYLSRRKAVLKELSTLPSFELPAEYATSVDLVHAARSERW